MRFKTLILSVINLLLLCMVAFALFLEKQQDEVRFQIEQQRKAENAKSKIRIVTEEQALLAKKQENKIVACMAIRGASSLEVLNPIVEFLTTNRIALSMEQSQEKKNLQFGVVAKNISLELNEPLMQLAGAANLVIASCEP